MLKKAVLVFVLIFLAACQAEKPAVTTTTGPLIGTRPGNLAPDFKLEDPEGNSVKLSDFRGKAVLLNFWGIWCHFCREEMPLLEIIYQDYKDQGFVILAVNFYQDRGESEAVIQKFMEENGYTFPVLLDPFSLVWDRYNLNDAVPLTYIIDSEGIIQKIIPGSRDWTSFKYRQIIEGLLPKRKS